MALRRVILMSLLFEQSKKIEMVDKKIQEMIHEIRQKGIEVSG